MMGAAVIVIVAGLFILSTSGWQWPSPGSIQVGDCPLVKPQFGRMECEPLSHTPITLPQISFDASEKGSYANYRVKCGDDENTQHCEFWATCNGGVLGQQFVFQISNPNYNCPIGSGSWCFQDVADRTPTKVAEGSVGTTLQISGCKKLNVFLYPGTTSTKFIPYGLNVYDSGGKYRYNTQSCSLDGFSDSGKIVTECGDNIEDCDRTTSSSFLAFDDWVNYLTGWTYVAEGIDSQIVDYQGQQAYCQVDTLYHIETINTKGGQCYKVPTIVLTQDIDCCPGMQGPNSECGDDFKWHDLGPSGDCFSDLECYGQGRYVPDYGTDAIDIVKYGCISNFCEVVDRKVVQCTPPNIGCPAGYVCNPNKGYICEKQAGPGIECGDGVCSPPYEDVYTCPTDCGQPGDFDWNIVWIIILALVVGLVGYKLGGPISAGVGGIMGGIIGYAVYWFLGLSWWQQLLLGIGAGAGGILLVAAVIVAVIVGAAIALKMM